MISPEDFIRLAGKLSAPLQGEEAQYRTAVSRAYYGAFHGACDFLRALSLRASHNHGEIQRYLMQCGHPRAQEAGQYLADLHTCRIRADYDLRRMDVGTRQVALDCVELASDIQSIIRELDVAHHREQIKAGIEAYRQQIRRT